MNRITKSLLETNNDILETLKFYADQTNWTPQDVEAHLSKVELDAGEMAHDTLDYLERAKIIGFIFHASFDQTEVEKKNQLLVKTLTKAAEEAYQDQMVDTGMEELEFESNDITTLEGKLQYKRDWIMDLIDSWSGYELSEETDE